LTRFEVDTVKIDRSFVRDMLTNRQAAALIEAIIAMAHALNLTVVAEGVETVPECNYLRGLGCDMIQGHVFSPAVPPQVLTEILKARKGIGFAGQ
jgi:EAL domain-containing protein (putative c-di-GMP-specific phosphodiesterase class I)